SIIAHRTSITSWIVGRARRNGDGRCGRRNRSCRFHSLRDNVIITTVLGFAVYDETLRSRCTRQRATNSAGASTMRMACSVLFALAIAPVISSAIGASPASAGEIAAISNVRHEPAAPKPNVTVLVTARLAPGVTKPVLKVQAVAPGKYIRKSDPA